MAASYIRAFLTLVIRVQFISVLVLLVRIVGTFRMGGALLRLVTLERVRPSRAFVGLVR